MTASASTQPEPSTYLFGGDKPWLTESWVASDDRVRGGKSQSYLEPVSAEDDGDDAVRFHGVLDTTALGGAGFASQRSPDMQRWDLSGFEGLRLAIGGSGDGKKYTLVIKDEILPKRPDGREQSTISWEFDFVVANTGTDAAAEETRRRQRLIDVRWEDLKPTYRGKSKPDTKPLDVANIKRISIMMRSFFGDQEGPFDLKIVSIAAVTLQQTDQTRL